MTPDELKALDEAIEHVQEIDNAIRTGDVLDVYRMSIPVNEKYDSDIKVRDVLNAARTLSQLMHGTHPDLVVVPREPTNEMIEAGELTDELYHSVASVVDVYKAMIAAARKDGV